VTRQRAGSLLISHTDTALAAERQTHQRASLSHWEQRKSPAGGQGCQSSGYVWVIKQKSESALRN
jgi:hypothetical protein